MAFDMSVSVLASVLVFALLARRIFMTLFPLPFVRIPGVHPLCHWTEAWIIWKRWCADENVPIYTAHKAKGALVRLSPTEVSINAYEGGIKVVAGRFDRSRWWRDLFTRAEILPMSALIGKKEHGARRKVLNDLFPNSTLCASNDFQKCLQTMTGDILSCLAAADAAAKPVNSLDLGLAAAIDSVTAHLIGIQNRCNMLVDLEQAREFLVQIENEEHALFCKSEAPYVYQFCHALGIKTWGKEGDEGMAYMNAWGERLVAQLMRDVEKGDGHSSAARDADPAQSSPVLYHCMKNDNSEGDLRQRLIVELIDEINAASLSLCVALGYCCYELAQNPQIESELRKEVMAYEIRLGYTIGSTHPDAQFLMGLDQLPLLEACITETMRKWPPIPRQIPRVAPSRGFVYKNHFVSGGTTISMSSYNLHQEPTVFDEPQRWDPHRWLQADPDKLQLMRAQLWSFGSGPFGCPGIHVGRHVMKVFVSSVFRHYSAAVTADLDATPYLNGIGLPESKDLPLRFSAIQP